MVYRPSLVFTVALVLMIGSTISRALAGERGIKLVWGKELCGRACLA